MNRCCKREICFNLISGIALRERGGRIPRSWGRKGGRESNGGLGHLGGRTSGCILTPVGKRQGCGRRERGERRERGTRSAERDPPVFPRVFATDLVPLCSPSSPTCERGAPSWTSVPLLCPYEAPTLSSRPNRVPSHDEPLRDRAAGGGWGQHHWLAMRCEEEDGVGR